MVRRRRWRRSKERKRADGDQGRMPWVPSELLTSRAIFNLVNQ
jgi:hypothetical protein